MATKSYTPQVTGAAGKRRSAHAATEKALAPQETVETGGEHDPVQWAIDHPLRAGSAVLTGGGSELVRAGLGQDNAVDEIVVPAVNDLPGVDGKVPTITGNSSIGNDKVSDFNPVGNVGSIGAAGGGVFGGSTQAIRPNADALYDTASTNAADLYQRSLDLQNQARGIHEERIGAPTRVTVGPMGEVQQVSAAEIGDAATAGPTGVGRAAVGPEAGNLLLAQATGQAPSQAGLMLAAHQDQIARQQLGIAAAARGNDRAAARYEAMRNIGDLGAQAGQQAAAARAGEMATATQALAGHQLAAAQLSQQANDLEAKIAAETAAGNRDAVNKLRSEQAQLRQRAAETNAAATNQRQVDQAKLTLEADTGNANRDTDVAKQNAANNLAAQEAAIKGQEGALGAGQNAVNTQANIGTNKLQSATEQYKSDQQANTARNVAVIGGVSTGLQTLYGGKAAHGAYVDRPTRFLTGEAGPEAIIPLQDQPADHERLAGILRSAVHKGEAPDPILNQDLAGALMAAALRSRKERRATP